MPETTRALTPASAPAAPPLLLGARAAARALSVSTRTLARLTAAGSVRCVHVGRRTLYAVGDLSAFVDRQRVGGRP